MAAAAHLVHEVEADSAVEEGLAEVMVEVDLVLREVEVATEAASEEDVVEEVTHPIDLFPSRCHVFEWSVVGLQLARSRSSNFDDRVCILSRWRTWRLEMQWQDGCTTIYRRELEQQPCLSCLITQA